ncbi:Uncharacterised protein [Vibrio cholerae]|nr:Uncharacterised protein [Vibrio cholerae]CSI03821.1 Uncharacterised protein [Vibrio cholerae]
MIHGRKSFANLAYRATFFTQAIKGLWRGHFMD